MSEYLPTVGSDKSSFSSEIAPAVGVTKMDGLEDSRVIYSPPLFSYESIANTSVA